MILLWWSALLFKLMVVSFVPLMSDENYYWVWSQNLSLSYYDHPPFVAWLFRLGSFLPDSLIKWPAVIFGHLALFVWWHLLKHLDFSSQQIRTWFVLSVMAPLVGMSAMVLTPDLPLLFFYSLTVFFFERALSKPTLPCYIFFGLAFGLGFTSKYHIVLVAPCLLIYLIWSGRWKEVRWGYLPVVVLSALVGALPVLLWNYQNDWASFRFQLDHGVGRKSWKVIWPFEYLASVILLIMPFYLSVLYQGVKENKQKLLISLSLPILGFFMMTSLRAKVEANWSQLAFLPLLSVVAYYDTSSWKARAAFAFWCMSFVIVLLFWLRPWFPGCPEKLCEPQRYREVIPISESYQPFMASNYQMASYLWFQRKVPTYKLKDMSRKDYFDTFPQATPKENLFYLAKTRVTDLPLWLTEQNYKIEEVKDIDAEMVLLKVYK